MQKGAKLVHYVLCHHVAIRTNSAATDFVVNAPTDIVHHYDYAQSVDVQAVANLSYHEHGKVPFVSATQGRVVIESEGTIEAIHLDANGVILENKKSTALPPVTATTAGTTYTDGTTPKTIETASNKEEVKEEAISNSELVFEVNGSWAQVAAKAKTAISSYSGAYKASSSVLASNTDYTAEQVKNAVPTVDDYYVEVGTIHINVDSIELSNVSFSANQVFYLSIGQNRFIGDYPYLIKDSKLFVAAPIAAFELCNGGTMKINKTNVILTNEVTNDLTISFAGLYGKTTEGTMNGSDPYSYTMPEVNKTGLPSYGKAFGIAFEGFDNTTVSSYVSRKLRTSQTGQKNISYGFSSDIDKINNNNLYGYAFYMTPSTASQDTSLFFTDIDKTVSFHVDFVWVD